MTRLKPAPVFVVVWFGLIAGVGATAAGQDRFERPASLDAVLELTLSKRVAAREFASDLLTAIVDELE